MHTDRHCAGRITTGLATPTESAAVAYIAAAAIGRFVTQEFDWRKVVAAAITGMKAGDIFKAALPYCLATLVVLVLLSVFPWFTTALLK